MKSMIIRIGIAVAIGTGIALATKIFWCTL
jgi:hypothetical protein